LASPSDIWDSGEQWSYQPVGEGYFQLRNIIYDVCLYGSYGPYAQLAACNAGDRNQHWQPSSVTSKPYTLRERATGYLLGSAPSTNKALTGNFATPSQSLWYD
jgi:hypothetical protein